jgi:ribosomal protein S18 acetylase RimI-like enzyme
MAADPGRAREGTEPAAQPRGWPLRIDERLRIVRYDARHAARFAELNLEWLERYFEVEPIDRAVLSHPELRILAPGGEILFALVDDAAVGTVALKFERPGIFELTKMAVAPDRRGRGIGRHLLEAALVLAGQRGAHTVYLYSNTVLEPAIALYRQAGFAEVPLAAGDDRYARSNIKMVCAVPAR